MIEKFVKYIMNPDYRFLINSNTHMYDGLSDEEYIKRKFKSRMGKDLDLDNPQTFNEKLQWLKLNDHKPEYSTMVDKYEVKKYVADRIGEEYVIPCYGVWNSFDDIDIDSLPEEFVLKCTHDCGSIIICTDKSKFNYKKAKKLLDKALSVDYYRYSREWPYKNVKPRILAEKYMIDTETNELRDYKFFTFNGKAKVMFIASDRLNKKEETKFDFYDMEFNHLPFTNGHPNSQKSIKKPSQFEKMIELAEMLSKGIPQVRVDFYEINGKVYFGEFTFYHWGGMKIFKPEEWDYTFGSWIEIPSKANTE